MMKRKKNWKSINIFQFFQMNYKCQRTKTMFKHQGAILYRWRSIKRTVDEEMLNTSHFSSRIDDSFFLDFFDDASIL